jgi:hypothetical protein
MKRKLTTLANCKLELQPKIDAATPRRHCLVFNNTRNEIRIPNTPITFLPALTASPIFPFFNTTKPPPRGSCTPSLYFVLALPLRAFLFSPHQSITNTPEMMQDWHQIASTLQNLDIAER